jgi:MerR family redox-sensitive transcriptional activator SoxR
MAPLLPEPARTRPPARYRDRIDTLTIGDLSARSGVAPSALRYYEAEGLIHATRTAGGQRRYTRDELRRVAFIRIAQQIGLSLDEIRQAMASLPDNRVPTQEDWERLSAAWQPRLEQQIAFLEDLKDRLTGCIGCGCLSMKHCHLLNPGDVAGEHGPGARYLLTPTDR